MAGFICVTIPALAAGIAHQSDQATAINAATRVQTLDDLAHLIEATW